MRASGQPNGSDDNAAMPLDPTAQIRRRAALADEVVITYCRRRSIFRRKRLASIISLLDQRELPKPEVTSVTQREGSIEG